MELAIFEHSSGQGVRKRLAPQKSMLRNVAFALGQCGRCLGAVAPACAPTAYAPTDSCRRSRVSTASSRKGLAMVFSNQLHLFSI
jgi:hypothetical protein